MIRWKCPQCQSTIGAPEWATGRRVPCPICTNGIKVPGASLDDPFGSDEDENGAKKGSGLCGCIGLFAVILFVIVVMVYLFS